jgi:hypothetical protein
MAKTTIRAVSIGGRNGSKAQSSMDDHETVTQMVREAGESGIGPLKHFFVDNPLLYHGLEIATRFMHHLKGIFSVLFCVHIAFLVHKTNRFGIHRTIIMPHFFNLVPDVEVLYVLYACFIGLEVLLMAVYLGDTSTRNIFLRNPANFSRSFISLCYSLMLLGIATAITYGQLAASIALVMTGGFFISGLPSFLVSIQTFAKDWGMTLFIHSTHKEYFNRDTRSSV